MELPTHSPTSEQPEWEPPAWLVPESKKVAADWWAVCEESRLWPESFVEAFADGYMAGYERGQRRRSPREDPDS